MIRHAIVYTETCICTSEADFSSGYGTLEKQLSVNGAFVKFENTALKNFLWKNLSLGINLFPYHKLYPPAYEKSHNPGRRHLQNGIPCFEQ